MAASQPTKRCSKCEVTKPRSEFYRSKATKSGLSSACKECNREYFRSERRKKAAYLWRRTPAGIACRKRHSATTQHTRKLARRRYRRQWSDPDKRLAMIEERKRYRASPKGKATRRAWREKNKYKISARRAVRYLVQSGKLPSPRNCKCVRCGLCAQEYHHHNGYEEPHRLDVVPVCVPCHTILDRDSHLQRRKD